MAEMIVQVRDAAVDDLKRKIKDLDFQRENCSYNIMNDHQIIKRPSHSRIRRKIKMSEAIELLKSARNYVESMVAKSVFAANLLREIDEYLVKPKQKPIGYTSQSNINDLKSGDSMTIYCSNEPTGSLDKPIYGDLPESKPLPEPVPGVAMLDGQPTLVKIGTEDTYEGRLYAEPQEISSDKAIVRDGLIKWLSKHASSDFNVFYSGENWDSSMLIDEINAESEVGKNFVSGFADLTIDLLFRKKEALSEPPERKLLTDERITEIANSVKSNIADGIYTYLNEFARDIEREITKERQ